MHADSLHPLRTFVLPAAKRLIIRAYCRGLISAETVRRCFLALERAP